VPESRVGKIVHISRGYSVAEIIEARPEGDIVVGYSVFGYRSDTSLLFNTQEKALGELKALADAWEADARGIRAPAR
jgi:hypothetical protein